MKINGRLLSDSTTAGIYADKGKIESELITSKERNVRHANNDEKQKYKNP